MKKLILLFGFLALSTVLFSCTNDTDEQEFIEIHGVDRKKIERPGSQH